MPSDPDHPVVIVVDDDASMRVAIEQLFTSAALASELFPSGPEMLARARLDRAESASESRPMSPFTDASQRVRTFVLATTWTM